MASLGITDFFDPSSEDWNAYRTRFEQYVITNEIKEEKKIVTVKLTDLVTTLREHFEPKPIVSANSSNGKVWRRTVAFLGEALRDRFVCGLRSRQIQRRLLAEKSLTSKTVVEMALAIEVADKQANNFRTSPADSGIHYVESSHLLKARPRFRCGEDHIPQRCQFKEELCRNCKSKGHIAKVCRKKAPASSGGYAHGSRPNQGGRRQPVRLVEDDTLPKEPNGDFKLFDIHKEKPEPFIMVPVKVNGKKPFHGAGHWCASFNHVQGGVENAVPKTSIREVPN